VWLSGHAKEIFGTINHLLTCKSDLAGSRPPTPKSCQAFEAPPSPRRGFTFLARVVRVVPNYGTLFQVFAKSIEVADARGLGHLFRVNIGQFCPISPFFEGRAGSRPIFGGSPILTLLTQTPPLFERSHNCGDRRKKVGTPRTDICAFQPRQDPRQLRADLKREAMARQAR
jgi:hypothetical protein